MFSNIFCAIVKAIDVSKFERIFESTSYACFRYTTAICQVFILQKSECHNFSRKYHLISDVYIFMMSGENHYYMQLINPNVDLH